MNDVDNQAMCQHVFAPKGLRVNCNNRNFKCPSIANPFYKPSEQSNLNQKDFEVAGSQEVGSGAIYGSKVPNEATALSTTENSLEVIPNFTPGARQPQQLSDASYLDLGNANAGLWPSSSKGKDPSISFSSKGKRNVRGLLNHFKVQML